MKVLPVGGHFKNRLSICDFLSPIHRDFRGANNFKCFRLPDALVVRSIGAFAYPLAQLAQFVVVLCITDLLVLGMLFQLFVFKWLSRFFINYRHCPVKEKFSLVPLAWDLRRRNNIRCVWLCALCNGLCGHWDWWILMRTCTPENGFRYGFLLGLVCFHPWIWCLHPWSWRRYPWNLRSWRLRSHRRLGHPCRWWCWGYESIWYWGYARFAPYYAVFNFWFGSQQNCGQLGWVVPLLEYLP